MRQSGGVVYAALQKAGRNIKTASTAELRQRMTALQSRQFTVRDFGLFLSDAKREQARFIQLITKELEFRKNELS